MSENKSFFTSGICFCSYEALWVLFFSQGKSKKMRLLSLLSLVERPLSFLPYSTAHWSIPSDYRSSNCVPLGWNRIHLTLSREYTCSFWCATLGPIFEPPTSYEISRIIFVISSGEDEWECWTRVWCQVLLEDMRYLFFMTFSLTTCCVPRHPHGSYSGGWISDGFLVGESFFLQETCPSSNG